MQLHHPEDLTDDGLQCSNASSNEFIYNPDMQPYGLLDWQRSRSPPRAHRASFTSGVSLREIASSSSSSSEHQGLVLSSAFPVREPDKHDFVEKQPPPSQSQSQSQSGQTIDVAFRQKVEDMVQELLRFYHVGLSLKLLQEDRELHSKLSALQRHFAMVKIHPPQGRIENSLPSPNSSVFSEGTTGNGNAIASVSKAATFSVTGEDY
ncbi:hypothetical protein A1O3_02497 [Capronia epimyces CBS 606.96]|uniref:Uncharacterized protein n=1 Tax=Capronia epimyces CBS 606.96 TaxID=1182542 RepID=W9YIF3_9EURO|nr:uncharacterized protein A1O3_02497 [Capronia epimyces CBS 606.96]EXJ89430.1 hypothetical protein A1O3_02497 [Capronia epimyces CBS 606.96]